MARHIRDFEHVRPAMLDDERLFLHRNLIGFKDPLERGRRLMSMYEDLIPDGPTRLWINEQLFGHPVKVGRELAEAFRFAEMKGNY